ncbi:MAG: hypothetical protein ACP5RP_03260 [Candidatus Micrarchaeia archaeon]
MPITELSMYDRFERYVKLIANATAFLLESEMNRGLGSITKIIPAELASKIEPYFIACGVLDMAGKEITKNNVQKILIGAGANPNKILLDGIGLLHYKNHMLYVLAIIFLNSLGKNINIESILEVAGALNADPDIELAKYAVNVYNMFAPQQGLETVQI